MLVGFIVLKYSYYEFHLIIKVVTPRLCESNRDMELDIHLIIKVVTPDFRAARTPVSLDIHSIFKVLTPELGSAQPTSRWIFTQLSRLLHHVRWNTLNTNIISQKLSKFFECLKIGMTNIMSIFPSKPQTKAFQHALP